MKLKFNLISCLFPGHLNRCKNAPKGIEFYTNGFLGKMFSSQSVMRERKKRERQRPGNPITTLSPSFPSSPSTAIQGGGDQGTYWLLIFMILGIKCYFSCFQSPSYELRWVIEEMHWRQAKLLATSPASLPTCSFKNHALKHQWGMGVTENRND